MWQGRVVTVPFQREGITEGGTNTQKRDWAVITCKKASDPTIFWFLVSACIHPDASPNRG